jgi:hypothetical protein
MKKIAGLALCLFFALGGNFLRVFNAVAGLGRRGQQN